MQAASYMSMVGRKRKRTSSVSNNAATPDRLTRRPQDTEPNGREANAEEPATESRKRMLEDRNGFKVHLLGANRKPSSKKKRLHDMTEPQLEEGIPGSDGQLDLQFMVSPGKTWDSLAKYRYFVLKPNNIPTPESGFKFGVGEFVFINHSIDDGHGQGAKDAGNGTAAADDSHSRQLQPTSSDERQDWIAWIREVRALDPENVFLRIVWMYWPEELPHGKEAYHGSRELVASNFMDIIDAMTVEGRANVEHFVHSNRRGAQKAKMSEFGNLDPRTYYWRQTYNVLEPAKLSTLPKDCICKRITNLDERLFQCPHLDCQRWWHESCLADAALRQYWTEHFQKPTYSMVNTENGRTEGNEEQGQNGEANGDVDGDTIFAVPRSNAAASSIFGAVRNLLTGQRNGTDVKTNGSTQTAPESLSERPKKALAPRFKSRRRRKSHAKKSAATADESPWNRELGAQLEVVDGIFTGWVQIFRRRPGSDRVQEGQAGEVNGDVSTETEYYEPLDTIQVRCLHDKCGRSMFNEDAKNKLSDLSQVDGTDDAIDPFLRHNGRIPPNWELNPEFKHPTRQEIYVPPTEEVV